MFGRSPSRTVGIRNCAGVIDDNMPPEFLEDLVRTTPEQGRIEIRNVRRGRLGLLLIRHDPVQVPIWTRKVPIRGQLVKCHDPSRVSHMFVLLALVTSQPMYMLLA